jgi:hypothetical protein
MSLYLISSLAKIKLVLFLLSIYVIRNWDNGFNFQRLLKLSIVILIILVMMWTVLVGDLNFDYLFSIYSQGMVGRILISEVSAIYPHLDLYGSQLDYIGISSLSNQLATIFGSEVLPRSGRQVLEFVSPGWVKMGVGGVYNTVFFGEAYANFEAFGLLISPIFVAFVYVVVILSSRLIRGPFRIAFLVHTTFTLSVMSGINDFIWNPFLIITFIFLVFFSRLSILNSK